jgi:Na+/H+ antiporter NhaD/arsenite permease-like protein
VLDEPTNHPRRREEAEASGGALCRVVRVCRERRFAAAPDQQSTNILFADAFHMTFGSFAARMIAPQLMALVTTYALLRWHFRRELPNRFDGESLPEPASVVPNRAYFLACVIVLVIVLVGYFLAPLWGLEPYVIAFAGGSVLVIAGAATGRVRIRAAGELLCQ